MLTAALGLHNSQQPYWSFMHIMSTQRREL
jgi:hypothetical protein